MGIRQPRASLAPASARGDHQREVATSARWPPARATTSASDHQRAATARRRRCQRCHRRRPHHRYRYPTAATAAEDAAATSRTRPAPQVLSVAQTEMFFLFFSGNKSAQMVVEERVAGLL